MVYSVVVAYLVGILLDSSQHALCYGRVLFFYGLSYVTINSAVTSINSPTWPQLLPTNFDGLMI